MIPRSDGVPLRVDELQRGEVVYDLDGWKLCCGLHFCFDEMPCQVLIVSYS